MWVVWKFLFPFCSKYLTYFMRTFCFYTPWKVRKPGIFWEGYRNDTLTRNTLFCSVLQHSEIFILHKTLHCVKSVRISSFSGLYFPAFGLNTERCGVSLRFQPECGKIRTRKSLNTDTFTGSAQVSNWCD